MSALRVLSFPVAFWPFLLALLHASANLVQAPLMSATDLSCAALLYVDVHPSLITPMTPPPPEKEALQPVGVI